MANFDLISGNVDSAALKAQLDAHPELWNQHDERKVAEGSPHHQMSDIWVRFRDRAEFEGRPFNEPHLPVWYPSAELIPAVKDICLDMMAVVRGEILGGVLITKIPPGGEILPHDDRGGWHAEYYNTKIYVPLQSEIGCVNHCEDEAVHMQVGEAWVFDNLKVHSVKNGSQKDRITLIVCTRIEP